MGVRSSHTSAAKLRRISPCVGQLAGRRASWAAQSARVHVERPARGRYGGPPGRAARRPRAGAAARGVAGGRSGKVVAVPKEGWRRFFEYVPLERETGVSRAGAAYSGVEVRYRLAR